MGFKLQEVPPRRLRPLVLLRNTTQCSYITHKGGFFFNALINNELQSSR